MKKSLKRCERCEGETSHSNKRVFSSGRMSLRRTVEKCNKCGKTQIKNNRQKNNYIKKLGGNNKNEKR